MNEDWKEQVPEWIHHNNALPRSGLFEQEDPADRGELYRKYYETHAMVLEGLYENEDPDDRGELIRRWKREQRWRMHEEF